MLLTNVQVIQNENIHDSLLQRVIDYYSSLPKLLRIVPRILCFMQLVKGSDKHNTDVPSSEMSYVENSEEQRALMALIRFDQRLLNFNHLKKLKPFWDDHGVYCVNTHKIVSYEAFKF